MNRVSGKVMVKETGVGIANLLVVVSDADPGAAATTSPSSGENGDRIGSVLTDEKGEFQLVFDVALFAAGDPEKRPDLVLGVFAPEDSQGLDHPASQPPPQRLLLLSNVPRQDAGEIEAYVLRIPRAQLEHFAIPYGNGPSAAGTLADSVLEAWNARDAVRERLKPRLLKEAEKKSKARAQAKTIFKGLSAVPREMRESPLFVPRGERPDRAQAVAIERGLDRLQQYRGGMRVRLTAEQLARMEIPMTEGRVDADADIASLLAITSQRTGREFVRARSLVDGCRDQDVMAAALPPPAGEPPPEAAPLPEPAVDEGSADEQLLSRILGQIRDLETSNADVVARRPDALRLQAELDALQLKGGPADAVALHDFHVLQIAFKHVWTEAFDETLRSGAESLYAEAARLAEERGLDAPVAEAIAEIGDLRAFLSSTRSESEASADLIPVPENVALWFPDITPALWNSFTDDERTSVTSHINSLGRFRVTPPTEDEKEEARSWLTSWLAGSQGSLGRIEKLLIEVGKRLSEPYAFHVFAPNTYNFGILSTYRQRWEPLAYQAGDLVATIPLAPGETRKYTQRVAVRKSRSERELEKSISSRREESSQTSRADAEIIRKASTATNFKQSAEGSFSIGIVGLSGTTDFARNQEEESANVKRDFREAVVRAAQDYSRERTIEVTTSASEDRDTSTSGDLSNPNNEITVTYLLYELQRRYRISEYLNRLTPVILVAQDVPAPDEVDEAWLLGYEWILRRVLLDDSLRPGLDYLREGFTGDELSLEVKKANWEAQKALVEKLETSLNEQLAARDALRDALAGNTLRRGQAAAGETSVAQDIAGTIATGGVNLLFGSGVDEAELLKAKRKAIEMTLGYAEETAREVQQKLRTRSTLSSKPSPTSREPWSVSPANARQWISCAST